MKLKLKFSKLIHGLGPFIKDVSTKSQKLTSLSAKYPYWLNLPSSCRHKVNFKNSEVFCTKKCERPHLKTYPDCGRLL